MAIRAVQDTAIVEALAAGQSHAEAARMAGVSTRTVRRRLDDAEFRSRVEAARTAVVGEATGRLCSAATGAVQTLVDLTTDKSPTIRLQAARAILENLRSFRQELAVEQQIAELTRTVTELTKELTSGQPQST